MFKIGEFSKLARVSARMLRHYDKCGLFCPAKTDHDTGYRLYSAEQMPLLRRIVELRDMGFGIDEIENILPQYDNAEYMRRAIGEKHKQITATIEDGQGKLVRIATMSKKFKEGSGMVYEVELRELPAVRVLSLRETIPSYQDEGTLWEKMGKFIAHKEIACNMNGYSIYHDDDYKEANIDMEIALPIDANGDCASLDNDEGFAYKELPALPTAATIRFSGSYENYYQAMEKLALWMEQNRYELAGNIRGHVLEGAHSQSNPDNFLTELQVPVRKTF